jgi:O-antigen ligase
MKTLKFLGASLVPILLSAFWLVALLNPVFKKYDYGAGWPLVIVLGVLLLIFAGLEYKKKRERAGCEEAFLLIFMAAVLASFYFSQVKTLGFSEVLAFLAVSTTYLVFAHRKLSWLRSFLKVVAVGGVLAVLVGFYLYFTEAEVRMAGPFFNILYHANIWPNAFALFLLMVWPLLLVFTDKKRWFGWALAALGLVIAALLLSYSRGALIAFAGQLVLLGLYFRRDLLGEKGRGLKKVGLVVVLALAIFMGANEIRDNQYEVIDVEERANFDNSEGLTSKTERLDFWMGAVELTGEKPLFGWGPYSFRYAYNPIQKTMLGASDHPHNIFLKISSENGLIALGAFLAFLLSIVLVVWRRFPSLKRKEKDLVVILSVAVAGAFAHNLIDYNFNFIANLLLLFLYLAFIRSLVVKKEEKRALSGTVNLLLAIAIALVAIFEGSLLVLAETDESHLSQSFYPRNHYINEADRALQAKDFEASLAFIDGHLMLHQLDPQSYYLKGVIFCDREYEDYDLLACGDNFGRAIELNPLNDWNYYRDYFRVLAQMPGKNLNEEMQEFLLEVLPMIETYFRMVENNVHFTAYTSNVEAVDDLIGQILDAAPGYLERDQEDLLKVGRQEMLEKAEELRKAKEY